MKLQCHTAATLDGRMSSPGRGRVRTGVKSLRIPVDFRFLRRKVRAPMNHQLQHNFARHAGQFLPVQSCRIVGIAKEDLPALGS